MSSSFGVVEWVVQPRGDRADHHSTVSSPRPAPPAVGPDSFLAFPPPFFGPATWLLGEIRLGCLCCTLALQTPSSDFFSEASEMRKNGKAANLIANLQLDCTSMSCEKHRALLLYQGLKNSEVHHMKAQLFLSLEHQPPL